MLVKKQDVEPNIGKASVAGKTSAKTLQEGFTCLLLNKDFWEDTHDTKWGGTGVFGHRNVHYILLGNIGVYVYRILYICV